MPQKGREITNQRLNGLMGWFKKEQNRKIVLPYHTKGEKGNLVCGCQFEWISTGTKINDWTITKHCKEHS